jgi:TRAP-type C4-dicarboxylate transport system substrate-binding protein
MTITLNRALAAAAVALCAAPAAQAQEVTLRVQHFLPAEATVPRLFIEPWAEKIEADSGGRIDVEVYPAMQLGGQAPALYDQIRDGVIDGGWALPAYTPGRFPEAEVFELPFMTSMSAEDSSRAAWEFTEEHLMDRLGDIHVCAVHVHGPGVVHTKTAVESLEDFQGLKLRGPSRQANALLETLGAEPIGMPVPAFPEALSRGVVDGGVIPWEVVPSLKVEELTGNHTQVGGDRALYNTFFIWGLNKAKVESLPEDLRAVIDANCGIEASAWAGRAMDEGDAIAEEAIAARGNAIHTLPEEAVSELRAIGEAQTQAWIEEASGKGLDGQAMVDDARALVEKHAGGAS